VVHRDFSSSADSGCGVPNSTDSNYTASPSTDSNYTASPSTCLKDGAVCLQRKEGKSDEIHSTTEAGHSCSLDEFQSRQKFMEEQNRQRKELVAKTLADRSVSNHCLQHKSSLKTKATKITGNSAASCHEDITGKDSNSHVPTHPPRMVY
jgi:hypothetical protein